MKQKALSIAKDLARKREAVALSLVVLIALLLLVTNGSVFLHGDNLDSLQTSIAPSTIVAVGMMVLLISGAFDLSVGSVMGLSGVVSAIFLSKGAPVPVCVFAGLCTGAAFGLLNGVLVAVAGINPLITTIGTMYIARGLLEVLVLGKGREGYRDFAPSFIRLGTGKFLGIYYMFWVMIVLVASAQYFVRRAYAGRQLYYVGGNREAAKLLGINTTRVRIVTYCFSGVMASLAGVLATARYEMANRYMGEQLEMKIIISCLIGGGSIAGGRGSIVGALLGVTFMSLLGNSFNIMELGTEWQNVVIGAVLIAVVVGDGYLYLRKQRALGRM